MEEFDGGIVSVAVEGILSLDDSDGIYEQAARWDDSHKTMKLKNSGLIYNYICSNDNIMDYAERLSEYSSFVIFITPIVKFLPDKLQVPVAALISTMFSLLYLKHYCTSYEEHPSSPQKNNTCKSIRCLY